MPNDMNALAPAHTLVGGMPLTSVDQLSQPQPSTTATPAPPPPAGVAGQSTSAKNVPDAVFGRSAPKEPDAAPEVKPSASTKAKDLGPQISITSTTAANSQGWLTQLGASAKFVVDPRFSVTASVREQLKDFSQPGKVSVAETRVSVVGKLRAVSNPAVDLSLEGYGAFKQPLGDGDATVQLGLRATAGVTVDVTKELSLGANIYADASRTFPAGIDALAVGGEVHTTLELGDGFKLAAGVRAQLPNVLKDGDPQIDAYANLSKQVNDHFTASVEVNRGIAGQPALGTSFGGELAGVVRITYTP